MTTPSIHIIQTPLLHNHKQVLRFLKGIANVPWVASELSNLQSLTHVVVDKSGYVQDWDLKIKLISQTFSSNFKAS